jgi:hypothetical protein
MIFLDFLIFNLAMFYEKRPKLLTWSTAIKRANYVAGIATIFWMISGYEIIEIFAFKANIISIKSLPYLIFGIGSMYLYDYVYQKKGRYEELKRKPYPPFNIDAKVGAILAWSFVFVSYLIPVGIAIFYFSKMGVVHQNS